MINPWHLYRRIQYFASKIGFDYIYVKVEWEKMQTVDISQILVVQTKVSFTVSYRRCNHLIISKHKLRIFFLNTAHLIFVL